MKKPIRLRFAPAPTGLMHIGNVRTALLNFLFAQQHDGAFILRIEDTDSQRNFDPSAEQIIKDLSWLLLSYDEGPGKGGPYAPYFQSERMPLYQAKLQYLIDQKKVYRCFCSPELLEKKRERQRALKTPPRYDRTCLRLSEQEIKQNVSNKLPFVWRFQLDHSAQITITDLARGDITFDMQHFSDFPLTRTDGSFTFLFANAVDDIVMEITYVFRGEDHLSNTASQAALYQAFDAALPVFWHMPILCNIDGKKLSKRDFGFSLQDLRTGGYLPEAIDNYLAIIGGSFAQEIMSLSELARAFDFKNLSTGAQIKYDVDKLRWINRQWIERYEPKKLAEVALPFIEAASPEVKKINTEKLAGLLQLIKSEINTLTDIPELLNFYFYPPKLTATQIEACVPEGQRELVITIVQQSLEAMTSSEQFVTHLKEVARTHALPIKHLFWFLRLALMGSTKGFGIGELVEMLGEQESRKRIETALTKLI